MPNCRCIGFSSTADNPLDVYWSAGGNAPHQFQYNLRYNFFNYVQVNWSQYVEAMTPNCDFGWDTHIFNFDLLPGESVTIDVRSDASAAALKRALTLRTLGPQ